LFCGDDERSPGRLGHSVTRRSLSIDPFNCSVVPGGFLLFTVQSQLMCESMLILHTSEKSPSTGDRNNGHMSHVLHVLDSTFTHGIVTSCPYMETPPTPPTTETVLYHHVHTRSASPLRCFPVMASRCAAFESRSASMCCRISELRKLIRVKQSSAKKIARFCPKIKGVFAKTLKRSAEDRFPRTDLLFA